MTIHLPEHLQRYVHDQVLAGHFRSEGDVVVDALERHRQAHWPPADPAGRRSELSSQEVQQRLFDAGLISEIKPPITDLTPYQNRRAVPIQGEPLWKQSSASVANSGSLLRASSRCRPHSWHRLRPSLENTPCEAMTPCSSRRHSTPEPASLL